MGCNGDGYKKEFGHYTCRSNGERNAGKILKVPGRRDLRPSDHSEMKWMLNAAECGCVMDPWNDSIVSGSFPMTDVNS
jgi:hypothetical protein